MMRILVVEDDGHKFQQIAQCLTSINGISIEQIENCRDALSAKRLLLRNSYDLLILDIVLPERIDSPPSHDAGIRLLDEISVRDRYIVPDHIVGFTGFADVHADARDRFAERTWTVIQYDEASQVWSGQLRSRVEHVLAARSQALAGESYRSEMAIICALDDPEMISVRRLPWDWKVIAVPNDATVYYQGQVRRSGERGVVHVASCSRMGMPAAAILAMKAIYAFRPRYLAIVGIAAGIFGKANPGDVLVADPSWDYGSGKHYRIDGEPRFAASPHQISLDVGLKSRIKLLSDDDQVLAKIRTDWPGDKPDCPLKIRVGPLASGAAVIADQDRLKQVGEQHRQLLGIEMEAYSIFAAAVECSAPRPIALALKSVCDFGDGNKDDRFQKYAAYTSAQVLSKLFADE
jgi:nucleoside phosphorylase/CheY-like chemotaxis protein